MALFSCRRGETNGDSGLKADEKGAVIMEFGILLPLMAFCCFVVADFFFFLHQYFVVSQIAREGARLAAMTPDLQDGGTTFSSTPSSALPGAGHTEVHRRSWLLATEPRIGNLSSVIQINSRCVTADDRVEVQINGSYTPIFSKLLQVPALPFSVKADAPYLYSSCAS